MLEVAASFLQAPGNPVLPVCECLNYLSVANVVNCSGDVRFQLLECAWFIGIDLSLQHAPQEEVWGTEIWRPWWPYSFGDYAIFEKAGYN